MFCCHWQPVVARGWTLSSDGAAAGHTGAGADGISADSCPAWTFLPLKLISMLYHSFTSTVCWYIRLPQYCRNCWSSTTDCCDSAMLSFERGLPDL